MLLFHFLFYFFTEICQKCLENIFFFFKGVGGNLLELFLVTFSPSWSTFVPVSLVCTEVKVKLFGWYVLT